VTTPIDWADIRDAAPTLMSTSALVRYIAKAELLLHLDPVRGRSQGEAEFRASLDRLYVELDHRVPRRAW
jgi:hypothetical protein